MTSTSFVVTGLGMHTPVGTSAVQTCAALRARLVRVREWPHFGYAGEPVIAGAIEDRDAPWTSKVELLLPPIAEALWQAGLYDHTWIRNRKVGLFLATPPVSRAGVSAEEHAEFGLHLRDEWGRLVRNARVSLVEREHVGGALALAQACEALSAGQLDAAVVAGVESQLHGPHLEQLLMERRLRTADRSSGVIPGEAAAVCVIETKDRARERRAAVRARLCSLALEGEAEGWSPMVPSAGDALARALEAALSAPPGPSAAHRVIVDHTGERWRFREWGLAEPRALAALPPRWRLWHPAESIGDVGAAFVPLAVGMAAQAFARGYAGSGAILIAACNISGERAALLLGPP